MTVTLNTVDYLKQINTATKYPSIPTYHTIDRGILHEPSVEYPEDKIVVATEKIDGTNARVVFLPDGNYLIGSRENLLYAGGDIVHNPDLGIVDTLRDKMDWFVEEWAPLALGEDTIVTVYGEVYGGRVGGQWKNYTTDPQQLGFRLFDVAKIENASTLLNNPLETISTLRENNRFQNWYSESQLHGVASMMNVPLTPRVVTFLGQDIATSIFDMNTLLMSQLPNTFAALGDKAGRSEGFVFRTEDRSVISKARFEDYDKTLRRMAKNVTNS